MPVCFDAKECATDTFPLANVHEHQIRFMEEFEKQEGIAFLLIYFRQQEVFYYLTYKKLREFWDRATQGGRKSFRYDELEASFQISTYDGVMLHYLEMINQDLQMRD